MYTPSDMFGSLVSDTEHLFDELQNHRALDRNVHGSPTPSISLSPTPEFQGASLLAALDDNVKQRDAKATTSNQIHRFDLFAEFVCTDTENSSIDFFSSSKSTESPAEPKKLSSRSAKKALLNAKQSKTFEQLDQMMEEILENDIPGMCTFNFGISPKIPMSSQSDGNIAMRSNE